MLYRYFGFLPLTVLAALFPLRAAQAPSGVQIRESFPTGYMYRVTTQSNIKGALTMPPGKDKGTPRPMNINGTGTVQYDERILPVNKDKVLDRTVRHYYKLDFKRTVDNQEQASSLRPEMSRLVVVRHQQLEVPFSPAGPLLWSEIDLVRTDVFSPSLVGLFPQSAIQLKDQWKPQWEALRELTDLEKITKGDMTCKLENVIVHEKRRLAQVSFRGDVHGVGEDGPCQHVFTGYYYFDLDSNHLSYLSLDGKQHLVNQAGQPQGVIEGSFVMTRQLLPSSDKLNDQALSGLTLEPTEENTQLLFDHAELGVRFLYPRRWRVGVANAQGKQIALDEHRGSGLLISLESLSRMPSGVQFQKETFGFLNQQKAKIVSPGVPKMVSNAPPVEYLTMNVEMNKANMWLEYYLIRQPAGGAIFAGRLTPQGPQELQTLQADLQRIARSLQILKQQ